MSGMGQSPKVIRVSFGAFSCTLEGFEDPVETLFAVTEHFRVLVAQDPGFAGETEVPDRAALERALAGAGAGAGELRVRWGARPELRVELSGPAESRDPREPAKDEGRSVLGRLEDALRALPRTLAAGPFTRAEGPAPGAEPSAPGGQPVPAGPAAAFAAGAGGEARAAELSVQEARDPPRHDADWVEDDAHWPGDGEDWPEAGQEAWPPRRFAPSGAHGAAETAGGRRLLEVSPDQDEVALQRFLSQAERQLADPGTTQRRAAMAHLKAAVAATRAQQALDGEEPEPDGIESFRREWASAARPRGWLERARPMRPPASQRVDLRRTAFPEAGRGPEGMAETPGSAAFEPAGRAGTTSGDAGTGAPAEVLDHEAARSFPRFAEAAGAVGLSDLLEAAATWASVVRGQEAVSRAELLRLAAEALPEPPRREDALRVFGTLLRQGRLARVDGGRFRLGEGTRFGADRQAS